MDGDVFIACLLLVLGVAQYLVGLIVLTGLAVYGVGLAGYGLYWAANHLWKAVENKRHTMMFTEVIIAPDKKKWSS